MAHVDLNKSITLANIYMVLNKFATSAHVYLVLEPQLTTNRAVDNVLTITFSLLFDNYFILIIIFKNVFLILAYDFYLFIDLMYYIFCYD